MSGCRPGVPAVTHGHAQVLCVGLSDNICSHFNSYQHHTTAQIKFRASKSSHAVHVHSMQNMLGVGQAHCPNKRRQQTWWVPSVTPPRAISSRSIWAALRPTSSGTIAASPCKAPPSAMLLWSVLLIGEQHETPCCCQGVKGSLKKAFVAGQHI